MSVPSIHQFIQQTLSAYKMLNNELNNGYVAVNKTVTSPMALTVRRDR